MPLVYSLKNPLTDTVYYIGYTEKKLSERFMQHLASNKATLPTTQKLIDLNVIPVIEIIEEGEEISKATEMFYIQDYKAKGCDLDNIEGIINYQALASNSHINENEVQLMAQMTIADRYKYALNKIKNELPLTSSVPIVRRINKIIETVLSI